MAQHLCRILFISLLFICKKQQAQFINKVEPITQQPKNVVYDFGAATKKIKDKPATYKDGKTNIIHAVYSNLDRYVLKRKPSNASDIYYTQSADEGKTWKKAKRISTYSGSGLNNDSTLKGPVCAVGSNGEIYATWMGPKGLMFQRSTDNGETWLKEEKIINPVKNGWQQTVDDVKTNGLPHIACDVSNSAFKNRIYISYSDEKYGAKNKDVFLVYSDDTGENWTEPLLVTFNPNHKEQFHPQLALNKTTGDVYLAYYDKQNYIDEKLADVYLAKSNNGGLKFEYYKINKKPVTLMPLLFLKDAFTLTVTGNDAKITWPGLNKKESTVYSAVVNDSACAAYNNAAAIQYANLEIEKTFAYADKINVPFKLKKNTTISAVITKPLEPGFEKTVIMNKKFSKGNNTLVIDTKLLGLKKGNYTLFLYYDSGNKFSWITEE